MTTVTKTVRFDAAHVLTNQRASARTCTATPTASTSPSRSLTAAGTW